MARVVNEHFVAILHLLVERFERGANVVARGLVVLQVLDIARRHLHMHRHLRGAFAVNVGTGQRRRAGVCVAADADDERMAVGPRGQAAHAQRHGDIARRLATAVLRRGLRGSRTQVHRGGAHPACPARYVDHGPAALQAQHTQRSAGGQLLQHLGAGEFVCS